MVHEFLAHYTGVLLSDFYPGYDAVPCRRQNASSISSATLTTI